MSKSVALGEVLDYEQPTKYIVESTNYNDSFSTPVLTAGQSFILGYTDEEDNIYTNIPCIIFDDFTTASKFVDFPFKVKSSAMKILTANKDVADIKYLFYKMSTITVDTGLHKRYWISNYSQVSIAFPSLVEQQKIAAILDKASELIADRKQQLQKLDQLIKSRFLELFGDPVTNPMEWDVVPLYDLITHANNGIARRGKENHGSIVLRLVELQDGYIDYVKPNRIALLESEKTRYLLRDNDFLFARVNGNPEYVGRCAVFSDIGEPVFHNDHIIRVRFDNTILSPIFASTLLNSSYGKREMQNNIKTSAGQYTINQDGIGSIRTILPPIKIQYQFADFVQQVEKAKLELQQGLEKLELQYKALMHKYFSKEEVA